MQGTKNLTEGPIKKQLFNLALPIMGTQYTNVGQYHLIYLKSVWAAKRSRYRMRFGILT